MTHDLTALEEKLQQLYDKRELGWEDAIEAAALTARGFNAAANSSAMRRFVNAGLIKEVYERDGAIADAIEALSKPASQQDGTRVVHVYGRKHLKPAPVAANASAETDDLPAVRSANDWDKPHYNPGNASAEARLREALDAAHGKFCLIAAQHSWTHNNLTGWQESPGSLREYAEMAAKEIDEALSAPHASDCDKQEENNERL